MPGILDGKVSLITGAGSGIGRATSMIFAREGARLVLADVVEAGGHETLRMVNELGADAVFLKTDVAKAHDVDAVVAKAVATYGRLDCAFNNAGIGGAGRLTHEYSEDEWSRVIAVKAATLEYVRHDMRINAVCPAPIYMPLLMTAFEKRPDVEARYARSEPMKRIGQPEEVGEAVAWLCSDRASYVTGLPMPVDGGYMAQ